MANHRQLNGVAVDTLRRGWVRRIVDPARPFGPLAPQLPFEQGSQTFAATALRSEKTLSVEMIARRAGIVAGHGYSLARCVNAWLREAH